MRSIGHLRHTLATLAFLAGTAAALAGGPGPLGPQQIGLAQMAPLQMEAGDLHAFRKTEAWIAQAKQTSQQTGRPIHDVLLEILNLNGSKGFAVYVDPDGKYRPDDGHHKVMAALEVIRRYHLDPNAVKWSVDVKADFRGKTWDDYGRAMVEQYHAGYFPPEILAESRARGETIGQLFQRLPPDFSKIGNSPMRSATGLLYDSMLLEGSWLEPYSQFYLGEQFKRLGVHIPEGQDLSPEIQDTMRYLLFESPQGALLQGFLRSMIRPEWRSQAEAALSKAKTEFLARAPKFEPSRRIYRPIPGASVLASCEKLRLEEWSREK